MFSSPSQEVRLTHKPRLNNIDNTLFLKIFPFMFLVKLQQGFVHGLYDLGEKTKLYVSSGAGFWGPSLRVFAPSEIVILNLKGKK